MTSNGIGLMAVILRYLAEIGRFGGLYVKRGRSVTSNWLKLEPCYLRA